MSEDKRKSARTQGRYEVKEIRPSRREKEKQKGQKSPHSDRKSSNGGEGVKSRTSGSRLSAEGISVEYKENSNQPFKELKSKRKPEELRFQGPFELSSTEHGPSRIIYEPDFFESALAHEYMMTILKNTEWHTKNIVIRGEEYPQPRSVAWYGPFPYSYSGSVLEAAEMPSTILEIKEKVETYLKRNDIDVSLNSVLLNLYRNERDSVAWHSDDELMMGVCPTIASVSLGEVRRFEMRPKLHVINQIERYDLETELYVNLEHGSLIIMDGVMQKDWQHRVPKEFHDKRPRINLTFRTVYAIDKLSPQVPHSRSENFSKTSASKEKDIHIQVEHKFDSENFPPLMPSNPKSKVVRKNSRDSTSSSQQSSPNSHEITAETMDVTTARCEADENEMYEIENQNNLNKDLYHANKSDSAHYNLQELEKSTDGEVLVAAEVVDSAFEKSYPDNNFVTKRVCQENGILRSESEASRFDGHSVEQSIIDNEEDLDFKDQTESKSRLNVKAPEFVPQSTSVTAATAIVQKPVYADYSLVDLSSYYFSEMVREEIMQFAGVVFDKLNRMHGNTFFVRRDWHEIETLALLTAGGQSENNQKLILDRVFSMIQNAQYVQSNYRQEYRSPHRYQGYRTGHGGDYTRNKNSHKANTRY